ncbi:hypothetical protein CMV_022139 [Castanea mollissima]|uniref:Prefoldin subunit 4 n=1 Tax=Castanea mollissima TaxID=60419 RepID=A0A8J4V8C9_9ROSI|nr:hypothetical protein CMV_022139 [Castanea mollissima]
MWLHSFTLHDMFGDTTLSSEAMDQLKVHPASKAPLFDICFIEGNGSSLKSLFFPNESNENLEDASNELILTNDDVVRFQIGEVFAHVSKDEVEARIEQMKEVTSKNLEKLEEEKDSVVAQMAELKKILYGKFNDSINLEED